MIRLDLSKHQAGHWLVDVVNQSEAPLELCLGIEGAGQFMFWNDAGSFAPPLSLTLASSRKLRLGLSSIDHGDFDVTARYGNEVSRKRARLPQRRLRKRLVFLFLVGGLFFWSWGILEESETVLAVPASEETVLAVPAPEEAALAVPAPSETVPALSEAALAVPESSETVLAVTEPSETVLAVPAPEEAALAVPALSETVPAPEEAVLAVPASEEAVLAVPAPEEAVLAVPAPEEAVLAVPAPEEAVYGAFSEEVPEAPVLAAQDPLDVAMDVAMGGEHANWQFIVFSSDSSEELTELPLEEAVTGVNSGVVVTEAMGAMGGTLTESLAFSGMSQEKNPQESLTYEQLFRSVASTYSLDWRLLAAIAYRESRFNPLAVGSQGEYGLMQILPSTWHSLAPASANPFDPETNVRIGALYLARLHRRDWGRAESYWPVVAYNWGPSNVARLLGRGGGGRFC